MFVFKLVVKAFTQKIGAPWLRVAGRSVFQLDSQPGAASSEAVPVWWV